MARTTAIIGGGFSGAMLAARIAEAGGTARLINRTPDFGLGVAYSTTCNAHVLNVRSGRMSARAGDHGHFVRWLEANAPEWADPEGFAPRRVYGLYVAATLAEAETVFPGRIERIVGEAVRVTEDHVLLTDGRKVEADAFVLATGNPPPRTTRDDGLVISDPWAPGALEAVGQDDDIAIIGTGLTMIDVVLALDARGWRGKAVALSRRGLTPRPHDARQPTVGPENPPDGPLSARLAEGRRRARSLGWAEMMDSLRARNAELWMALTLPERARFLRHLRPWWDVHRHRAAPGPSGRIAALIGTGRLRVMAGRLQAVSAEAGRPRLDYRPRGERRAERLVTDRIIDCTGPGHDPTRSEQPLIRNLLADRLARPDPLSLGLDVAADGRLIDASGRPAHSRFVLGPPAAAAFWETVAVPDIRDRIESVAGALT